MAFNLTSIIETETPPPPRIIVYGPAGCGKTTLASEAFSPILIRTEDGAGRLKFPRFPLAKSFADVMGAIKMLADEDHKYSTVAVDSLDWLEPLVFAEACARNGWPDIEKPGYGKGYAAADEVWREFFAALNRLRDEKKMMSILIAHSHVKRFEDPASEGYDRYSPKLHARGNAIAQEWADAVLFMRQKTYISAVASGFQKAVTKAVGAGERILCAEERPSHLAKNRYGMPAEIAAPLGGAFAAVAKYFF